MHGSFRQAPYDYLQVGDHVIYHPFGGHNKSVSGMGIIRDIISSVSGDGHPPVKRVGHYVDVETPRYIIENCKSRQKAAYHIEDICRKMSTK